MLIKFVKSFQDIQTAFEEVEENFGKSLRVLRMKEEELKSESKSKFLFVP
jgi:hypothetical protein